MTAALKATKVIKADDLFNDDLLVTGETVEEVWIVEIFCVKLSDGSVRKFFKDELVEIVDEDHYNKK